MNVDAYIKAANRGDFQYEVAECDDYGGISVEECKYKGKGLNATITKIDKNEYEVEVDDLLNEPFYICQTRSSKRLARELLEKIIINDRNGSWENNLRYIETISM